jgi:NAD(P)H-dependent FMN reductase
MPRLLALTVSTRPSRKGPLVARWFETVARAHGGFDVDPVDLADMHLPLLDEPEHPRLRRYHHDHTRAWSARVDAADALVFVMPEYNYTTPPSLVNAIDYLFAEWAYKPVGFVTYGGVSGGLRAMQSTKLMVTGLKMVPMVEAVAIPFFSTFINAETQTFAPDPKQEKAATAMLDELRRWTDALAVLRTPAVTDPIAT